MARWRRLTERLAGSLSSAAAARLRTSGYPTSANGASSLHLTWELPAGTGPLVAAVAELTVEAEPPVRETYFWALQASFTDAAGRRHGGGHLGLQWYPPHPRCRAVNWGGYAPAGHVLAGSASPLPSTTNDPNTRDLPWEPGRPHTLRIERAPEGGWAGSVDGVRVRTLDAGGDRLTGLMVWSEVFARCDAPPVAVRWSGLRAIEAAGGVVAPAAVRVNYQRRDAGGCDNTTAAPDGDGVRQVTGTARVVPQGARLALP